MTKPDWTTKELESHIGRRREKFWLNTPKS